MPLMMDTSTSSTPFQQSQQSQQPADPLYWLAKQIPPNMPKQPKLPKFSPITVKYSYIDFFRKFVEYTNCDVSAQIDGESIEKEKKEKQQLEEKKKKIVCLIFKKPVTDFSNFTTRNH